MTDKETSREGAGAPIPSPADETAGRPSHPAEETAKPPADLLHTRQVEYFKQSLAGEGERAYARWGMPLFHSLSDEEAESQRQALGFDPKDALDFYNRGCLLASREEFSGAAKAFERAAQLDPSLSEAFFNRALALERAGERAATRRAWQAYLELFGENEDSGEVKQHLESLNEA